MRSCSWILIIFVTHCLQDISCRTPTLRQETLSNEDEIENNQTSQDTLPWLQTLFDIVNQEWNINPLRPNTLGSDVMTVLLKQMPLMYAQTLTQLFPDVIQGDRLQEFLQLVDSLEIFVKNAMEDLTQNMGKNLRSMPQVNGFAKFEGPRFLKRPNLSKRVENILCSTVLALNPERVTDLLMPNLLLPGSRLLRLVTRKPVTMISKALHRTIKNFCEVQYRAVGSSRSLLM